MEFCSRYGYDYGFQGSDEEEISDEEGDTQIKTTKRFRRADSNIVAVKFDSLTKPKEMRTENTISCGKCTAFVSSISKKDIKELVGSVEWTCEFCGELNIVKLAVSQIPMFADVTYLLEPVVASNNVSYLTFCLDLSGSMDNNIEGSFNGIKHVTRLDGIKQACIKTVERLNV